MKSADYKCFICGSIIDSNNLTAQRNHLKRHKKQELISYVSWDFVDKTTKQEKEKEKPEE